MHRHEFKAAHGLRKYFKTYAESAGVKTSYIEFFMDHKDGVEGSYHKPPTEFALTEYLKAVEKLTINDDKSTLQKHVAELTEKSEEKNYALEGRLAQKEREVQETKKMLQDLQLQQQIMRAEYEIGRANNGNVMAYLRGVTDKLTFHVPCYRQEDPEEEKIKELLELVENLRKKRVRREKVDDFFFFSFL